MGGPKPLHGLVETERPGQGAQYSHHPLYCPSCAGRSIPLYYLMIEFALTRRSVMRDVSTQVGPLLDSTMWKSARRRSTSSVGDSEACACLILTANRFLRYDA